MLPSVLVENIVQQLPFKEQEQILLAVIEKLNATSPVEADVFFTEEEDGRWDATLHLKNTGHAFFNYAAIAYIIGAKRQAEKTDEENAS